jgi:hypothetical protein
LERELATLQMLIKAVEETYGLDNLHLTVAKAYPGQGARECARCPMAGAEQA